MEVHAHTHTAPDPDPSTSLPTGQAGSGHRGGVFNGVWLARGVASIEYCNNGFQSIARKSKVRQRAVGSVHLKMSRTNGTHLLTQFFHRTKVSRPRRDYKINRATGSTNY